MSGNRVNSSLKAIGILMLLFLLLPKMVAAQEVCTQKLRNARNLYQEGKLERIPDLLSACIKSGFSKEEKIEALRLITLSYLYNENETAAQYTYLKLLLINPEFEPNREADPTELILLHESFDTAPKFFYGVNLGGAYNLVQVIEPTQSINTALNVGNYAFSYTIGAGLFFQYPLTEKISVSSELNFHYRSLTLNKSPNNEATGTAPTTITEDQSWLELPLLLNYELPFTAFPLELAVGPSFHYLLNANVSSEGAGTNFNNTDFRTQRNQLNMSGLAGIRGNFKILGMGFLTVGVFYQHRFFDETLERSDTYTARQQRLVLASGYQDGQFRGHAVWLKLGVKFPFYNPALK